MDINFVDNKLMLPASKIAFKYNIYSVVKIKGGVAVLLDIPSDVEVTENIYALDLNGKKIWKVQSVKEVNPNIKRLSPYVGMALLPNGNISATTFYGLNYEISAKDGKILSSHMAK